MNEFKTMKQHRWRQTGLTMLEVMISLAIISSATLGINAISTRFSDDTKNTLAASQVRTFGEAAKAYIKNNYAAVQSVASATSPALIDVATLIAAGNLTPGFAVQNAFGQSMCALVLEPTANRLQAMVVSEGGTSIDDVSLGNIAAIVGGSGGGVYSSDASIIRGAIGGWALATSGFSNLVNNVSLKCDGTAGNVVLASGHPTMALWFENGDTSSAFLARDAVPGRPELNAMNTPIVMNSVQIAAAACTSLGAIARDGAGGLLTCKASKWVPAGDGKCVATSSDLNILHDDGRCYNGVANPNSPAGADWFFLEVYRHTNPANFYTAQRVVGMTGSAAGRVWQRNQQSATSGAGWGAWVQQADSEASIAAGGIVSGKQGNFSKDKLATCCAPADPTLAVSEHTASTGRKPSIQFHAGGLTEGAITLDGAGNFVFANSGGGKMPLQTARVSTQADDWGLVLRNAAAADNIQPLSGIGSAYVNDIYIRSSGKWASQLGGGTINFAGAYYVYVGDGGTCPANHVVVGVGGFYATYTAGYLYCAPVS